MKKKQKIKTKIIPQDKNVCKSCTTPRICRDMGAFNTCRLQKLIS